MGSLSAARSRLASARDYINQRRFDNIESTLAYAVKMLEDLPEAETVPILAEIEVIRAEAVAAEKAEESERFERDVKRYLAQAEEEIRTRGNQIESTLLRAVNRLANPEVREKLTPEALERLEAELRELQAKAGIPSAPPPERTVATPVTRESAPAASAAAAPSTATPAPAAAASLVASGGDPEQARLLRNDVMRSIQFGEGELNNNVDQAESYVDRGNAKLDSDQVRQHLSADVIADLRGQLAALQAKVEVKRKAAAIQQVEDWLGRYTRHADDDADRDHRQATGSLQHAIDKLASDEAQAILPPESKARFQSEIERIQAKIEATKKRNALKNAYPILEELEEKVAGPIYEGLDEYSAFKVSSEIESLKTRVRGALYELAADDPDVQAIDARLAAVDERIAAAGSGWGLEQAIERLTNAFQLVRDETQGWEDETQDTSAAALGDSILPNTTLAVRRLRYVLEDTDLLKLRDEYKDDATIQSLFSDAEHSLNTAVANLDAAFDAILDAAEQLPTPTSRFDLEKPGRMAANAHTIFEGTPRLDDHVARATALGDKWQADIDRDRAEREALYAQLSGEADAAWPAIARSIDAENGFDPLDTSWRGRTIRLTGIRNRIGWDFSGPYDFAIWVNGTPLVGNFTDEVRAAFNAACERTRLGVDDHTDWDAFAIVGGPGKIKERYNFIIKNKGNLEIGKVEEWRPIDCVMCSVIALHAGPVAVGPA